MKAKSMRIKMLRTKFGSPDGYSVKHFEKDTEYDVPESLGEIFVKEKDAEAVEGEKAEAPAPKNKAEKAPKNKAE